MPSPPGLGSEFTPRIPLGYLQTYGPRADPATALTWGLLDISIAVSVVITLLVVVGVLLRRVHGAEPRPQANRGSGALAWLWGGMAVTIALLAGSLVWTIAALAQINSPAARPALTIAVIGHQWWWEANYPSKDPTQAFATANEIHIPVGQPVEVRLTSADVIHSFWAPALTGKTDTIPGRTNVSWLEADKPGVYYGQCTEYCGAQHAHMALYVVAQPPAAFAAWRAGQIAAAAAPADAPGAQGAAIFMAHCAVCHTIRGTDAGGKLGPDLTHLMSRRTIAAGLLPNQPAALAGWIANPPALKPDAKMPPTELSGPDLNTLTAYLGTLH